LMSTTKGHTTSNGSTTNGHTTSNGSTTNGHTTSNGTTNGHTTSNGSNGSTNGQTSNGSNVHKIPNDLVDVMKVLPKNATQVRLGFAFFTLFRVWVFMVVSTYLVYICPWYLLPLGWIFMGTCMTGLFVLGHECAHQSFTRSRFVNEVVGTFCMMPLVFPYNGWELTHNHHHKVANNIEKDHLWRPLKREEVNKMNPLWKGIVYYFFGPFFFLSSIFHHAYHFALPFVSSRQRWELVRSIFFCSCWWCPFNYWSLSLSECVCTLYCTFFGFPILVIDIYVFSPSQSKRSGMERGCRLGQVVWKPVCYSPCGLSFLGRVLDPRYQLAFTTPCKSKHTMV